MASLKRMIDSRIAAVLALALALIACSSMAYAETANSADLGEKTRQSGGQNASPLRNPRDAKRPYVKRNEGREAQRMSPEERRQLRRDIKDAGREIYPPRH